MNKSFLTLLMTASLLTAALTGCAEKEAEPAKNTEQTAPDLNKNEQGEKQDDKKDVVEQQPTPEADPSHKEIQAAFGLDNYKLLSPVQIAAIGLGQMDLGLDEKARLSLAKAMSAAMGNSGWQPGDLPPALFMEADGSKFAVGMKKADGTMTLERFELQESGEYVSQGKETK